MLMNSDRRFVRILALPPGDAPEWVRESWVGLDLPLSSRRGASRVAATVGVLTGPRNALGQLFAPLLGKTTRQRGYAVKVSEAIVILQVAHPDAAEWWRTNTPHLFRRSTSFLFAESVCKLQD